VSGWRDCFESALGRYLRERLASRGGCPDTEALWADLDDFVLRRAKRVRPVLFLAACRLFGGWVDVPRPAWLQMAIALELFHSFILVHDDLIDRSDRRRGAGALHRLLEARLGVSRGRGDRARLGSNAALVLGDMLFAESLQTMARAGLEPGTTVSVIQTFLQYVEDTGCGELCDVLYSGRDVGRVTEADILRTYALKTTKYTFECPLVLGSIVAGAGEDVRQVLVSFSKPVGLAFQIQNDLDEFRDQKACGKEIVEDLAEGKKTLLIRRAWNRLSRSDRVFLQTCFDARHLNDAAVNRIRELVFQCGAFAELESEVARLFEEAAAIVADSGLAPDLRQSLLQLVMFFRPGP
jgi:geranylgeranyl diphosphate synthase type I